MIYLVQQIYLDFLTQENTTIVSCLAVLDQQEAVGFAEQQVYAFRKGRTDPPPDYRIVYKVIAMESGKDYTNAISSHDKENEPAVVYMEDVWPGKIL
jgi:hypothetical protein